MFFDSLLLQSNNFVDTNNVKPQTPTTLSNAIVTDNNAI